MPQILMQIRSINDAVILLLTISVLLILLIVILFPELRKNELCSKMIGSLFLIIIAMASSNSYVYIICVFFIGLIIASERFSLILAALMRAPKDFLNSNGFDHLIRYGIASKEEIEQKIEKEVKEENSETCDKSIAESDLKRKIQTISETEERVLNYVEKELGPLDRHITLSSKEGIKISLDASISGTTSFIEVLSSSKIIAGSLDYFVLKHNFERKILDLIFRLQSIFETLPVSLSIYIPHNLSGTDLSQLKSFVSALSARKCFLKNIKLLIIPIQTKDLD